MRFPSGGRSLERLAGSASVARRSAGRGMRVPSRWRTIESGPDPWAEGGEVPDQAWLRERRPALVREALQQGLLFPLTRFVAHPTVTGADDLMHAPQPAVLAPNHASDLDTPLILAALPRAWRVNTVVGAASDRFYRKRRYAVLAGLWINTFPFDRGGESRGLADAAELLREGRNVLLYPQGTRTAGLVEGFRSGVARLCVATGVPLIPVHVGGTALIMPKDRGLVGRGRTTVAFGRPVYPAPGDDPLELMLRASSAVSELAAGRRP